jgi:hypothetical protein
MLLFLRIATDTEINKGWKLEVDIDIDIDIDIDQDSVHLAEKQSLIIGNCGSQLISVFSNIYKFKAKRWLPNRNMEKFKWERAVLTE